jgi:hypothetical protein
MQDCQEEGTHIRYKQEKSQVQTKTGIILIFLHTIKKNIWHVLLG